MDSAIPNIDKLSELSLDDGKWDPEDMIFDVSPDSTPPSSPISEGEFADFFPPKRYDSPMQQEEMTVNISYDPIQHMVSILDPINTPYMQDQVIFATENALCGHLFRTAVTLSDVQIIFPTLHQNTKVMHKLATNIGLYHSRTTISPPTLEQILIHILTHDTPSSHLFALTTTQISRFHLQSQTHQNSLLSPKKALDRSTRTASRTAHHTRLQAQKLLDRYASIPPLYHQPSAFLPMNSTSIAQLIAEIDGMHWTQAKAITALHDETCAEAARLGMSKKAAFKLGSALELPGRVDVVLGKGTWAQTRVHHGPGFTEKRRGKGRRWCFPRGDGRVVMSLGMRVGDGDLGREIEGWGWVASRSVLEEEEEGGEVVVRVPGGGVGGVGRG